MLTKTQDMHNRIAITSAEKFHKIITFVRLGYFRYLNLCNLHAKRFDLKFFLNI